MAAASIETTLEALSLRDVKARIRPLFTQERGVSSASQFLDGLLGNEPRKTGWMRAEAAGEAGPWRQQAILGLGEPARGKVTIRGADPVPPTRFKVSEVLAAVRAGIGVAASAAPPLTLYHFTQAMIAG